MKLCFEMVAHLATLYDDPDDPSLLLEAVGIDPESRTPIRRLSGGEQRRVAAAAALVGRPALVFLDEPTAGLDSSGRRTFHDLLRDRVSAGLTVVLTTHLMDDVERLDADLDRDSIIGRLEAQGISAKPYLPCIHLQPYYQEAHGHRPGELPVTEAISASTIALPFFCELTEQQVDRVCTALDAAIQAERAGAPGPVGAGAA